MMSVVSGTLTLGAAVDMAERWASGEAMVPPKVSLPHQMRKRLWRLRG